MAEELETIALRATAKCVHCGKPIQDGSEILLINSLPVHVDCSESYVVQRGINPEYVKEFTARIPKIGYLF